MPGLPIGKKATTLSLTAECYQKLRKLIAPKPISEEIDEFIKRRIAELEGQNPSIVDQEVYADLKRQHNNLLSDGDAIKKRLERLEVYDQLIDLADSLGLDFNDLHNADEVALKILDEWGSRTQAHQFISLMEISRELRKTERRLTEIRTAKSSIFEEKRRQETEPEPAKKLGEENEQEEEPKEKQEGNDFSEGKDEEE